MPGLGPGYNGDGGPAVFAQLANPQRVLSTAGGGFLIADSDNQRVRSVSPAGIITTIAGDAVATYAGDSGAATDASIFEPVGGSPTTGGGLLIADVSDPAIREVTIPPTTTITLTPSSPNEANGWYIGTVHAKVSAGAGNTTNCDLDLPSAPTVFDELDSPCAFSGSGADITGNGVHLLWAASMNSFGDKETPVAFAIEIDNNPPSMRCVGRPSFVAGSRHKRVEATVADAVSGPQRPVVSAGANTGRIASHTVTLVGANNTGIASLVHCHYTVVAGTLRPLPTLSDAFSPAGSATTVTRLVVRRVPARAQVNLTCTGTGCPVLLGARCHRRRVLGQAVHRHPSAAADPAHDRARAAAVGRAAGERRAADGERDRGEHRRARVAVHDPRRAGACAPHRVSEARVLGAR